MCPFIYSKNITAQKSKIEKMKIEYFFGRKLFLPHCARGYLFMLIKMKPHMHFDIRKKNYRTKIENFHCYVHRFAVSKVDLPPARPLFTKNKHIGIILKTTIKIE
jgi:hypothetical protein